MALNETIQRLFSEINTPSLSLDPTAGVRLNRFPEEVLLAQAQSSEPQANQPRFGYQIGESVGGTEFTGPAPQGSQQLPIEAYNVPDGVDPLMVNQQWIQDQRRTQPRPDPEATTVPRENTLSEELSEILKDIRAGKLDDKALANRLAYLKVLQEQEQAIEGLRAKTALEKRKIDENIAKCNANALREAEVARALTMVAYKASRPDTELVQAFMSPMSGLSSLYKAVGPVQGANIQLPRSN